MNPTKKPSQVAAAPCLTAAAILAVDDLRREPVNVPEWGGSVWVRALTGAEREEYEMAMYKAKGDAKSIRAGLVARSLCDESGARLFTDSQIADLGRKSGAPLERLFNLARRLSGISTDDVDQLEKN